MFRDSSWKEPRRPRRAPPGIARTWGRAKRARNRHTGLNAMGTIWYGFERAKARNNRALVTGTLFDVISLILEKVQCKAGENPDGYDPPGSWPRPAEF